MNLQEYQYMAQRTTDHSLSKSEHFKMGALGLIGETGEVVDLLKKHLYHKHPLDKPRLTRELGDVMWYLAEIAATAGLDLEIIGLENIEKLKKRYPEGFDTNLSLHRAE